jgi:hypothetical protein
MGKRSGLRGGRGLEAAGEKSNRPSANANGSTKYGFRLELRERDGKNGEVASSGSASAIDRAPSSSISRSTRARVAFPAGEDGAKSSEVEPPTAEDGASDDAPVFLRAPKAPPVRTFSFLSEFSLLFLSTSTVSAHPGVSSAGCLSSVRPGESLRVSSATPCSSPQASATRRRRSAMDMPSSPFSGTRIVMFDASEPACRTLSFTAKLRTQTGFGRASSASFALCRAFRGEDADRAGALPGRILETGRDVGVAFTAYAGAARAESRLAFTAVSRDTTLATREVFVRR